MFTLLRLLKRSALSALLLLLPLWLYAQQVRPASAPTKPYTVIYKLKPQGNARVAAPAATKLQGALQKIGAKEVHRKFPEIAPPANARLASGAVDLSLVYELQYSPSQTLEQVQRALLSTGAVTYVEPVYQRTPLFQPNDPSADSAKTSQYYLKLIKAYAGWETEQANADVLIGILDTGTRWTHLDLKDKVKYNAGDPIDGIDNDGDGYTDNYQGWDFADNDNDPSDDTQYKGHGTAVAGVAAAATDNAFGMAGVGYNASFLPLKVFSSNDSGDFGGYEAIVYAANEGCKVINLSWGGEGHSQYEQDVINYAVLNKDVVVVAAAGNTDKGQPLNIYPAAYDNVLSVGGTTAEDVKYKYYTYNQNIDLTAPCLNVLSASPSSDTQLSGGWSGTSFATPMVSGAAALVRAHFPELNARQVMERLRVTTDDIYQLAGNKPYLEMLGKGRLNIQKALLTADAKAVRCTNLALSDKQLPYAGTTVEVLADFTNFLTPVQHLQVQLTSPSPYITVTQGTLELDSMGTMASANNQSFRIQVKDDAPNNVQVNLRLGFTDGTYTDYQYFTLVLNPDYVTLNANDLKVTINSKGNFGYNGLNKEQGEGVQYKDGGSLLFEGGLLLATDATHVSDNIRNELYQSDGDFTASSNARLHLHTPQADQVVRTVMHDNAASGKNVGVQVKHLAYAWSDASNRQFVILEYQITNRTDSTFKKLYTGLFADWNIGNYTLNAAEWDAANAIGYVHSTTETYPFAGFKLLTGQSAGYYAIDNLGGGPKTFGTEDGFTSAEKFTALSAGVGRTKANGGGPGNNVSQVVSAAVDSLAPGQTTVVAFALLVGDNLQQLQEQAAAAQQKYRNIKTSPAPVAYADTACAGTDRTWAPEGGSLFHFYADADKTQLLGSGASYTLSALSHDTTLYAASIDSLYESVAVPATFSLPAPPAAGFQVSQPDMQVGVPVRFINTSQNSGNWRWRVNGEAQITTKDLIYTFPADGTYTITLTVTDTYGCSEDSTSQTIELQQVIPTGLEEDADQLVEVYPNPTRGYVRIHTMRPQATPPQVRLVDMMGRSFAPVLRHKPEETEVDLSGLAEGVYLLHLTYDHTTLVKRLVLLQP